MTPRLAFVGCLSLAVLAASCAAPRSRPDPGRVAIRAPVATVPDPAAASPESRPVHARLLDLYDRDRDGVISRAEYPRDDAAFRNLDRDHDGVITAADSEVKVGMPPDLAAPFLIVMRLAGPDVESIAIGDLDEAFESVDESHDGAIDRAEFAGPAPAPGSDRFAPVLAAADADQDGKLTLAELKTYAAARDRNADGRLSRRERLAPGEDPKTGWFQPAAREPAPDFKLTREDGGPDFVSLSSFKGKSPVALIFGSFT